MMGYKWTLSTQMKYKMLIMVCFCDFLSSLCYADKLTSGWLQLHIDGADMRVTSIF